MAPTDDTAERKLESALAELWKRSRFTSYFYQTVDLAVEPEIPTLALLVFRARLVLYYSAPFIAGLPIEPLIGLLVHEMLHVVMNHNHRAFPEADPYLQNLAQDMVINSYLTTNRKTFFSRRGQYSEAVAPVILPTGLPRVPPEFIEETSQGDPPWEDLYHWLSRQPSERLATIKQHSETTDSLPLDSEQWVLQHLTAVLQNPLNIPDAYRRDDSLISVGEQTAVTFTDGEGRQLPTGVHMMMTAESVQQQRAKQKGLIQFAAGDARCQEERVFQQLKGIIGEVREQDTTPWSRRIKSLVDFASQSSDWRYTYGRFNRRYFAQGIYAAGRVFEEKGRITVAVDVSGSVMMQPEMLEAAFGVVDDLTRKYTVQLVCIDEQLFVPEKSKDHWIRSNRTDQPYTYSRGDWKYIRTGSMGTTFFSPLFNDYMTSHREMLLVITDGQIYDLDMLQPYRPTLWIVPEARYHHFVPPFGQVVSIQLTHH